MHVKCLQQHWIGSDVNVIIIVSFINTMVQWSQPTKIYRTYIKCQGGTGRSWEDTEERLQIFL